MYIFLFCSVCVCVWRCYSYRWCISVDKVMKELEVSKCTHFKLHLQYFDTAAVSSMLLKTKKDTFLLHFFSLHKIVFQKQTKKGVWTVFSSFARLKMKPLFPLFHMPLFHMFHTLKWYIEGRNGKKTAMQWNFNQRLLLL